MKKNNTIIKYDKNKYKFLLDLCNAFWGNSLVSLITFCV